MSKTDKLAKRLQRRTERLRLALDRKGWTKYRFQRELEERGIPGTSRANVDRYLSGEVEKPPVDFYVESATLLDVKLLWLLGMTEASTEVELAAEELRRKESVEGFWLGFDREIVKHFPAYEYVSDYTRGIVISAWAAYDHYLCGREEPAQGKHSGVAEVGAGIMAPLKELGIEIPELSRWQLDQYVTALCQAIMFLNLKYGSDHPRLIA